MRERLITIDEVYSKEHAYLIGALKANRYTFAESRNGTRKQVHVAVAYEQEERKLAALCSEILFTAFKWRFFAESTSCYVREAVDKALMFVLLDFDSAPERRRFNERFASSDELHVDALYNFGLGSIKSVWAGYEELILDFYNTKPDYSDKLELAAYMLSVSLKHPLKRTERYFIYDGTEEKILQRVFFYHEVVDFFPKECAEAEKIVKKILG